jgi:hypothetical protein
MTAPLLDMHTLNWIIGLQPQEHVMKGLSAYLEEEHGIPELDLGPACGL